MVTPPRDFKRHISFFNNSHKKTQFVCLRNDLRILKQLDGGLNEKI